MAITIKKTKLTLKAPVAEAESAPVEADAPKEESVAEERLRGSGISIFNIVILILAIVSFVLFGSLLLIQTMELSYYKAPPTAFADFVPQIPDAPPAPEAAPEAAPAPEAAAPEGDSNAAPAAADAPAPAPAPEAAPAAAPTS